ncbi:hypothetical protein C1N58_02540 [Pantoea sp. SGAir0180]
MTTLAQMNKWTQNQQYNNINNELFDIEVELFESPDDFDYWQGHIKVSHATYGNINFVCYLPKEYFNTFSYAQLMIMSGPLSRVKSILDTANGGSFPRNMYRSPDGWMLF